MSWCVSPWVYLVWILCISWSWLTISFSMLGKFSTIISSKIFSYPFFFSSSSSSGTPIIQILVSLRWFLRSLRLSSALFILFTLVCSLAIISTLLSSLIRSSASDILLLIPYGVFLISVIVLFDSVYLFFNSSRSL